MISLLAALIVFIFLAVHLIRLLIVDFFHVVVNIPLLSFILLRSYFEIRHKKVLYPYLFGLGITTFVFLLWFDMIQIKYMFWQVLFLTMVFVIANIIMFGQKFCNKHKINKKSKK